MENLRIVSLNLKKPYNLITNFTFKRKQNLLTNRDSLTQKIETIRNTNRLR